MKRFDRYPAGRARSAPARATRRLMALWLVAGTIVGGDSHAADPAGPKLEDAQKFFLTGKYAETLQACKKALEADQSDEGWTLLKVRTQMLTGQYAGALELVTNSFRRYPLSTSIRLKLAAREVFLHNGLPERAEEMLGDINRLAGSRTWAYREPMDFLTLGKTALLMGADPKLVIDRLFEPTKQAAPDLREIWQELGELALRKGDFALAATYYREGLKKLPNDPELRFGLARAFAESDRRQMLQLIEAVQETNPRHIPSRLLLINHLVDGEEYEEAEKLIKEVLEVNAHQPEAWAYRAVMAHMRNDAKEERAARGRALAFYSNNPAIDQLIGRKLSQKYRFAEGAEYQRQALKYQEDYLPAKMQLAQDLLRLGREAEGWQLAEEVAAKDGYDVTAFNLITLKGTTDKYATLTNEHFILRMDRREAGIYGARALALLTRAHHALTRKYDCTLPQRTIVEIFANQNDFGVRTFGMPDNPGFLGVCFGPLITANSPASQGESPSNWEAVLWHEFAHVITLTLTRNKMPRWLSEGISVFEERAENPAWGQALTPRYREFILDGDFVPLSKLSSAFLTPRSDAHLQFAYFESYLAVDFLVGKFGVKALRAMLKDLGDGREINDAIARHTKPMKELDADFEEHVRTLAKNLAPGLDFAKPETNNRGLFANVDWSRFKPNNFYALTEKAVRLLREEKWDEARAPVKLLLEHFPDHAGPNNGLWLQAKIHNALEETEAERKALVRLALLDADALDVFQRLMDLEAARTNWTAVRKNAGRFLAVNPLLPEPHRRLAEASEQAGDHPAAAEAWRLVLQFNPADPARIHHRLAENLRPTDREGARRHVLLALEEAPRYRAAHQLLLELQEPPKASPPAPPPEPKKPAEAPAPPKSKPAAASPPPAGPTVPDAGDGKAGR